MDIVEHISDDEENYYLGMYMRPLPDEVRPLSHAELEMYAAIEVEMEEERRSHCSYYDEGEEEGEDEDEDGGEEEEAEEDEEEIEGDIDDDVSYEIEYFTDDEDESLDTTREQRDRGKDVQGIPWESTSWTRDAYRTKRNQEYKSYFNQEAEVEAAREAIAAETTKAAECKAPSYEFFRNWRGVRPSIVHFQLRNLVCATSSHEVYYISENRVVRWNNQSTLDAVTIMDVSGAGPSAVAPGLGNVQLCTLCAKHGIIAAGGLNGEVLVRRIGDPQPFSAVARVATVENGITNAIDCYRSPHSGALRVVSSNNDAAVRVLDVESGLQPTGILRVPWAVNCCAVNPAGTLIAAVGDHTDAVICDPASLGVDDDGLVTGERGVVARLQGHYDFSFSAAWHPDGNVVATGNQDRTTRLFDLRMTNRPLAVLAASIGAVRSLRFSSDGMFLAVAEPSDYVTLYSAATGYRETQTIDLFGEIAGISFSPDNERLFLGLADVNYSSFVQFNKHKQ